MKAACCRMDEALSASEPVVLEVKTDPEIAPLPPHVSLGPARSGLNVALQFTGNLSEDDVARMCKERGIRFGRLSRHCIEANVQGLVLGFATCGERNMATFVGRVRSCIEQAMQLDG